MIFCPKKLAQQDPNSLTLQVPIRDWHVEASGEAYLDGLGLGWVGSTMLVIKLYIYVDIMVSVGAMIGMKIPI